MRRLITAVEKSLDIFHFNNYTLSRLATINNSSFYYSLKHCDAAVSFS